MMMTKKELNRFWETVASCEHEHIYERYFADLGTCSTPGCGKIIEVHCRDCGIYLTECKCGKNDEFNGWSYKRRKNHANKHIR
jgi:hypothetical protein